jgi:hypothetical protein
LDDYDFFQFGVDPVTRHYRSEDFFFVDAGRAVGFETYVMPQARTVHTGSHNFVCNMTALASLGPTRKKSCVAFPGEDARPLQRCVKHRHLDVTACPILARLSGQLLQ